jgi:hypothetical protein
MIIVSPSPFSSIIIGERVPPETASVASVFAVAGTLARVVTTPELSSISSEKVPADCPWSARRYSPSGTVTYFTSPNSP